MRRWYVPLTVLGLGSVGAMLLSERGRRALRSLLADFDHASGRFMEWKDDRQHQLDSIQAMLDGIAKSLGPHPKTSG